MEPKDSGGTKASVARARRQGPPPRGLWGWCTPTLQDPGLMASWAPGQRFLP